MDMRYLFLFFLFMDDMRYFS